MKIKIFASLLLTSLLSACGNNAEQATQQGQASAPQQTFEWKLVTSWPKNFPGLGTGPERFADRVEELSAGRLKIKVYGAGQLVPALEVFDAVSRGTAEMGHSGAYYWKGKSPAAQFFTSVPFGLNAQEMHAWIHYGGGMEIWKEVYEPFNLIPLAGGNTGVQMGGWFNKEINSIEDLDGLKMRMPGLGGEVLERAGGTPVTLPGAELFTALQTGAIDATEWVGPYNDLAFGLHKAAKYYYYPGWHEPGSMLEFMVNKDAFEALPKDLQAIVRVASRATNQDMLDEYTARNNQALKELVETHGVQLRAYPDEVLNKLKVISDEVLKEVAAKDPLAKKAYESFKTFKDNVQEYHTITEQAYLNARN
ncbi:TRAP transporter substrate-binding protein [Bermanella marisrubri]|uniref:TRAP-type mannitol/chloroaromatic compound transport system, periplasmic component n=1 Tax=Bermanella marisrubri TaxID=207949 RepID=Q1N3X4_9GAMM|nr:TRAP transporter substrate-binding protein [Bermanella marisrubri]EAT13091.1 TRAP-type mannitol/chloroaromatic compound transport system, periplasmic component [Oceanobacter sp. RED65] [Bermanella marisrubri]QIZ82794.1 TRAP transporter substrate-binding protein [Bermanella marisrubri]